MTTWFYKQEELDICAPSQREGLSSTRIVVTASCRVRGGLGRGEAEIQPRKYDGALTHLQSAVDHSYDTDLHFKDSKNSSLLFWSSCNICRFPGGQVPLGKPPRIWAYYTTICRDMSLSFCKWISISTEILRNCLRSAEKKARILNSLNTAYSHCTEQRT